MRHRGPLDRATASACLMANLLVLPGLGSWIAGRKTGLLQMFLALLGFSLTLVWAVWFVKTWMASGQWPTDIGPHFGKAVFGILLFLTAWFWALASSLVTLRDVK